MPIAQLRLKPLSVSGSEHSLQRRHFLFQDMHALREHPNLVSQVFVTTLRAQRGARAACW
jgi:hypothetical protein